jgi:hypothetical protein
LDIRNAKIINATAAVGEGSINLATSSKSGRLPLAGVRVRSSGTMRIGLVTGGPYYNLGAGESVELGVFQPGDPFTLFHIRTGGADVAFDVIIWS